MFPSEARFERVRMAFEEVIFERWAMSFLRQAYIDCPSISLIAIDADKHKQRFNQPAPDMLLGERNHFII